MKEKTIYLIGFMGSGKSTVARALARGRRGAYIEMDEEIVKRAGKPITRIFAEDGEETFRCMETALLKEIAAKEGAVVSCGGGAVTRPENVALMKENGKIVLLTASPEAIYERVKDSKNRPLLNDDMSVAHIQSLMEARKGAYEEAADRTVDTEGKTIEEIVEEIEAWTKRIE